MLLLDPINGITSVAFYRKAAAQSVGRTALYLAYLSLILSVALTAAMKIRLGPALDETFVWLERSMPPLTYDKGRISSALAEPLTLRHPQVSDFGFVVDTARTEPVTPQLMEEQKVLGYLTATTFYLRQRTGKLEVFDLTKGAANPKPVVIGPEFYREAGRFMNLMLYPLGWAIAFVMFMMSLTAMSLGYSLVALAARAVVGVPLAYGALFNIAAYAQSLSVVIQTISLFTPVGLSMFSFPAFVFTCAYVILAVKGHAEPAAPPAPAS